MVLYNRKKSSKLLLILILIVLAISIPINKKYYKYAIYDIYENIMTYDFGFSSIPNLIGGDITEVSKYNIILEKAPKIIDNYLYGVKNRPDIQRLDINIKFKNFKKIIEDRERAVKNGIGNNFREVKGKLIFNGENIKVKLRLKGDYPDHWRSLTRMSFRIIIKDNHSVLGYKAFSIQKPYSRQHPYDQIFQELSRKTGNISSSHNYVHVYFNGKDWGIMNIEEHMTKELLEKQRNKESLIVKFSDEKLWQYWEFSKYQYNSKFYRLSDPFLNIKIYGAKKYLKDNIYRKWMSYIAKEQIKQNTNNLYDINSISKAMLLALIWGDTHTLAQANSKFYFNPYLLKLSPITLDQIQFSKLVKPLNISTIYAKIMKTKQSKYINKLNLKLLKPLIDDSNEVIKKWQSYFPLDEKLNNHVLLYNLSKLDENISKYIRSENSNITRIIKPTKQEAKYLFDHIYARHFDNGEIHIYNLLPDDLLITDIYIKDKQYNFDTQVLKGYEQKSVYKPLVLKTDLKGLFDNQIKIKTKYQGYEREFSLGYTHLTKGLFNPLENITNISAFKYITKDNNGIYKIKKGIWNINKPLVLDGDLEIEKGTTLKFNDKSYLIVNGNIEANATDKDKIIFTSQSNRWKGIYIYNAEEKSILNNVEIKNTQALSDGLLNLTGGCNFYKSDVDINNTLFYNTIAEDSLNIVHSNFTINNTIVQKTISDGFDSDFSKGKILNSSFLDIGGDGIDFSGSDIYTEYSTFENIHDKAISAGESTNIEVRYAIINNVGIGIASKDGSRVTGNNIKISNYKMNALMSYTKKVFYDNAKLIVNNVSLDKLNDVYLRQKGTFMKVNKKIIKEEIINVKSMYKSGVMKK